MKTLLFPFLYLLQLSVAAQTKIDIVKFSMIKAGVDFYATDTSVFKKSTMTASACNSEDYLCLEQFCQTNGLSGVDTKIKKWKEFRVVVPTQLKVLKDTILKDLTNAAKNYRTKLPAFELFQKKMTELAISLDDNSVSKADENNTVNNDVKSAVKESISIPKSYGENTLTWVALLTAILSLAIGVYLFLNKDKKTALKKQTSGTHDSEKFDGKMAALKEQANLINETLNKKIEALDKRLEKTELWVTEKKTELKKAEKNSNSNIITHSSETSKKSASKTLFALLPDLDFGFSEKILKNSQDGEQGYEITVRDDTGTYEISGNEDAQAFAVNDFNFFLSRGCNLANQPFPKCRVKNLKPGKLIKTDAGWMIQEKADIEFV